MVATRITSNSDKSIYTKLSVIEVQKRVDNTDNYIMLFDVWSQEFNYMESIQIEKKRIKEIEYFDNRKKSR